MSEISSKRYFQLFTEPPKKEGDWKNVERDLDGALRKNVQRVQQKTGTSEGRRESVYIGDTGAAFMEITLAERRRCSPSQGSTPSLVAETPGERDPLPPTLLTSLADHHLASAFHDGAFTGRRNGIRDGAHISFLETPVGIATLVLSRYPIGKQKLFAKTQWTRSRDYLQSAVEVMHKDDMESLDDDDGCETLYGRAGFLYALLYLRSTLARAKNRRDTQMTEDSNQDAAATEDLKSLTTLLSDMTLERVIRSIIRRGRNGAKTYQYDFGGNKSPPLMWTWYRRRYLGGAHGVAGILQMLLDCPIATTTEYIPEIVQTIDWLVHCQDRTGNWPTRAPDLNQTNSGEHGLVQWCHGAPAVLILLSTILRMSVTPGVTTGLTDKQQERFVVSLQRGCALVYMHGFLRKGVGLCHGVAGSVYALLAASSVLDDPQAATPVKSELTSTEKTSSTSTPGRYPPYFTQAAHLAHLATYAGSLTRKGDMRTPDHPWSLYEGMAGMCCAWEEILYRMRNEGKVFTGSGMPGYDDLAVES